MKYLADITCGYVKVPVGCIGELEHGKKALLYLHGNGSSIERQEVPTTMLYEATNIPIILPEYSGHGDNTAVDYEETMPAMHMMEVLVAYDWLCTQVGEENIVVYGTSYGGMLTAAIMKWRTPHKVILFAPTFIRDEKLYTGLKRGEALSPFVNRQTQAEVANIILQATSGHEVDLLVMKAEYDESVAPHVVDAWVDVYPSAKLVTISNARHSIKQSSQEAQDEWLETIREYVNG